MPVSISRFKLVSIAAVFALASCAQKTPPPRTYPLGDKVSLGHLVYSAYETQWMTQLGGGADARVPQNRFFLVRLAVTNSGGESIASPNLSVIDDDGNTYAELADGQGVPQWIGYIRQIAQTDTTQGNLVFDVAPRHYKLRITDEEGQRTAFIDLPLEFNSEVPEVAQPAEKKQ